MNKPTEGVKQGEGEHLPLVDNWLCFEKGGEFSTIEVPLHTDVSITGDGQQAGPYTFLNPIVRADPGVIRPAIVLRYVEARTSKTPQAKLKTNTKLYHGGSLTDEIAAFTALALGARCGAAGPSRIFGGGITSDPLGRPVGWYQVRLPASLAFSAKGPMVPFAFGSRSLTSLAPLEHLRKLNRDQVVAIMRAANLFNDALWLCEQEPHLSWLMLVSALEGAAVCWKREAGEPVERLRTSRAEFCEQLEKMGRGDLLDLIAREFADSLGVTKKFVDFCLAHLPDPPQQRPVEALRIDWTPDFWRSALKCIYKHRSKALHEGIPFPAPLCEPPYLASNEAQAPTEKGMIALATTTMGGTWNADDAPVNLNIFAQFTRGVLMKWLNEIANPEPSVAVAPT